MKEKGFTLIELLAVIVILAVVAAIVTPIISNIISKVKVGANRNSAEGYVKAAEDFYIQSKGDSGKKAKLGTNIFGELKLTSKNATNGNVIVDKEGNIYASLLIDNKCYIKTWNSADIYVDDNITNCGEQTYASNELEGTDPVVTNGMIPVILDSTGEARKADISKKWFDYEKKEWANMVLVESINRNKYQTAEPNTIIEMSDILGYFVWIPRYKYQLFNVEGTSSSAKEINIVIENKSIPKSAGSKNGEWYTPQAFTFGNEELNGIWVGKFETTGNPTTPTVLPLIETLVRQNVSTLFTASLAFSNNSLKSDGTIINNGSNIKYGINNTDSHMAKSSEWATVSYFANSKYGRCTNGVCEEVYRNNNSNFISGYGAISPATTGYVKPSISTNLYGTTPDITQPYNTSIGFKSSTTGNITGIYDMVGGAWEITMGVLMSDKNTIYTGNNSSQNSGFNGAYGVGGTKKDGIPMPKDKKYYDAFSQGETVIGTSINETKGWYSDKTVNIDKNSPWIVRGGAMYDGTDAGMYYFDKAYGMLYPDCGFRTVIVD